VQSCKNITELVTDYLEGKLPLAERIAFRVHTLICPGCRRYIRQMRATIAHLGRLPEHELPGELLETLQRAFRRGED
jgi:anti-sigma factor RsiW